MKQITVILGLFLACLIGASAQNQSSLVTVGQDSPQANYRLYPTQNIWTFLELNTKDGRIWQVQYSTSGERFKTSLNLQPLASGEKCVNGRFTLYPTQNMWNFILLDTIDGRTWQVQWSQDIENRVVVPIY